VQENQEERLRMDVVDLRQALGHDAQDDAQGPWQTSEADEMRMSMNSLEKEIARKWLEHVVPEIIRQGGNEGVVLAITEHLLVGTLHVVKEVFHADPQRSFEIMKRQVDQRLADMEGEDARRASLVPS
jgi:hypothetical protein